MYNDRVVPVRDLGEARSLLGDIDSQILRSFGTGADERALTAAARQDEAGIDALIETYEATYLVDAEKRGLADFHTEWDGYAEVYKRVARFGAKHKDAQASSLYLAEAAPRYAKVDAALANLVKVNDQMASGLNGDIAATYRSSRTITIVLLLAALALGAALAWRVSSEEMIAHQRQMAATAGQIAGGDLTVTVTPKSAEDGLGNAFAEMVANLRELVGEVAQSAGALVEHLTADGRDLGGDRQRRWRDRVRGQRRRPGRRTPGAHGRVDAPRHPGGGQGRRRERRDRADDHRRGRRGPRVSATASWRQPRRQRRCAASPTPRARSRARSRSSPSARARSAASSRRSPRVVGVVADSAKLTEEGVATVDRTRDAFEAIGVAVEDMTARVREIATAVGHISGQTRQAELDVAEVAAVAEQSSASAEQVSASTQQTSATTQEIAASADALARTAGQLDELVRRFRVTA